MMVMILPHEKLSTSKDISKPCGSHAHLSVIALYRKRRALATSMAVIP